MTKMEKIKRDFKNCEYIDNAKIKLENGKYTTIVNYLAKELDIPVKNRTQKWINTCLLGFWGNQRVKCLGRSDKIFEILNSIYEKLK